MIIELIVDNISSFSFSLIKCLIFVLKNSKVGKNIPIRKIFEEIELVIPEKKNYRIPILLSK